MIALSRRSLLIAAGSVALFAASEAGAVDGKPFLSADAIPLMKLLTPPPAIDSAQTKAELDEILALQASRTEAQAKHAAADAEETVFRFLAGMGVMIEKEKAPLCAALFERVVDTEDIVTDVAKKGFGRPRPHTVNDAIKPIVKVSKSGAYPSGHATYGALTGLILAEMLPEMRAAIGARILDFSNSRIIAGAHYRSDLEPGRVSGALIANALFSNAEFLSAFEPAKAEMRKALGL